jgi:transcriptional regulator with XRE-family HTH domain
MIQRIKKMLQVKKMSPSSFADRIGVPRSTISHILSGRNNPSLELVQKILDSFPDVRTEWLVRGEGNMINNSNSLFPDEDNQDPGINEISPLPEAVPFQKKISSDEFDNPGIFAEKNEILDSGKDIENAESGNNPVKNYVLPDIGSKNPDKNQKKTSRVIIFFTDGTFSEYIPG